MTTASTPTAVAEAQANLDTAQNELVTAAAGYNDSIRQRFAAQDAEQSAKRIHIESLSRRNQARLALNAALDQSYVDPQIVTDLPG